MFLDHLQRRLPGDLAAQTTIVFDAKSRLIGDRPPLSRFRGEVLFASDHDEADDLIEQLIRDHSAPKRLTVVTADRRIQQAARRRRAQVISSEEWLDGLEQEEELD